MRYLLDTNVCIELIHANADARSRYADALLSGDELCVCSISVFELTYGVWKSSRQYFSRTRLRDFLSEELTILPVNEEDAAVAGNIQAELERLKQPIGPFDTLIAGQALARGLTVVTANVREFSRVDGLKWVDWTQ